MRRPAHAVLFLVSVLILFLELLLIRWISTELRVFAYLQNVVLVVCFLGLGMGCFCCARPVRIKNLMIPLVILGVLLAVAPVRHGLAHATQFVAATPDFVYWAKPEFGALNTLGLLVCGSIATLLLMILVWDCFVPLGQILGRLMDADPRPIRAYSINVAGSLIGGWLFVLLSAREQPPLTWLLVLAVGLLPLILVLRRDTILNVCLLVVLVICGLCAGFEPGALKVRWSPYQKLALYESERAAVGKYRIDVNNIGYQVMLDLSERHVLRETDRFPAAMRGASQYDVPLRLHPNARDVLIVGAGTGNDAAGALRQGAAMVTAVEIDPGIIAFGREWHPERPYDSQRVRVVNDDARAFFASSQDRFDVICFGLLDSHTTGAMTNARLDHYVYTCESIRQARSRLKENGILVLSFEAQKPYIADRIARVLLEVFGRPPLCFRIPVSQYGWGGVHFVAGDMEQVQRQLARQPELARLIKQWQDAHPVQLTFTTPIVRDDWPYIYLQRPSIPLPYVIVSGLMLLLFWRGRRQLGEPLFRGRWRRDHWHFFCLGAAFMLLEVQSISKAAVVLGSTWQVNAVIISGILIMILAANAIAARFPAMPLIPVYALLLATCVGLYCFDLAQLASLPHMTRVIMAGSLTTLPMLFSGIVFVRAFAVEERKHEALGANMFGALVGGLVQTVTFLTGVKALLLIVTSFYFIALLTRPPADGAVLDQQPA